MLLVRTWIRLSPEVPVKKVPLSEEKTPLTGAVAVPESGTAPRVPVPLAPGMYEGTTPPAPRYVTKAIDEFDAATIPVEPPVACAVGTLSVTGAVLVTV